MKRGKTMQINCCNQDCPKPVLDTKKALESLENDSILEVLVNATSSVENIKRYATNNGYSYEIEELEDNITKIIIIKGYECNIVGTSQENKFLDKTIFIKDDKVGDGELGNILMEGFLKTTLEFKELPKNIILVNKGVFLTTKNQTTIEILKEFENRGVNIYSCGLCMNFYKIDTQELQVGEIGNAYDSMDMLLHTQTTTL